MSYFKQDESCKYFPCKNWKSCEYDNIEQDNFEEAEDGKIKIEPSSCDKCNLELMLSDSDLYH